MQNRTIYFGNFQDYRKIFYLRQERFFVELAAFFLFSHSIDNSFKSIIIYRFDCSS